MERDAHNLVETFGSTETRGTGTDDEHIDIAARRQFEVGRKRKARGVCGRGR